MLHGIFVAATGLVLSASAHGWSGTAAWPDSAQRQAMQLQDVKSFTPELLTIKGNVTLLLHALATAQRLDHSTIRVDSPYSGKGSFRAFAWLQKRPAPVVFILSGLFADLSVFEGFTAEQLLFFHRQGYHVVVLPTVGGQSAMDDHSTVLPFSVVDVGKLELGLLNKILRRLGPERIRGVHVVGQSYGGFIAAVVAGLDASSARPVIDETTAISPIYDARKAILDLDSGIRRNSAPEYAG
ncbi:MAG: hypothetical protein HY074_17465, partial [Deltaproteobacteria bacterium]|nr:hypothetical protein [Deltaproteobacteria bacterium]